MDRLINAPHLADQPHEPYSDLFVLAGSKAWKAWDNGKGEEWLLLCSLVEGLESKQKPVILGKDQLSKISSTRIAKEDQQLVKIAQYGELKQEEITAICHGIGPVIGISPSRFRPGRGRRSGRRAGDAGGR